MVIVELHDDFEFLSTFNILGHLRPKTTNCLNNVRFSFQLITYYFGLTSFYFWTKHSYRSGTTGHLIVFFDCLVLSPASKAWKWGSSDISIAKILQLYRKLCCCGPKIYLICFLRETWNRSIWNTFRKLSLISNPCSLEFAIEKWGHNLRVFGHICYEHNTMVFLCFQFVTGWKCFQ